MSEEVFTQNYILDYSLKLYNLSLLGFTESQEW